MTDIYKQKCNYIDNENNESAKYFKDFFSNNYYRFSKYKNKFYYYEESDNIGNFRVFANLTGFPIIWYVLAKKNYPSEPKPHVHFMPADSMEPPIKKSTKLDKILSDPFNNKLFEIKKDEVYGNILSQYLNDINIDNGYELSYTKYSLTYYGALEFGETRSFYRSFINEKVNQILILPHRMTDTGNAQKNGNINIAIVSKISIDIKKCIYDNKIKTSIENTNKNKIAISVFSDSGNTLYKIFENNKIESLLSSISDVIMAEPVVKQLDNNSTMNKKRREIFHKKIADNAEKIKFHYIGKYRKCDSNTDQDTQFILPEGLLGKINLYPQNDNNLYNSTYCFPQIQKLIDANTKAETYALLTTYNNFNHALHKPIFDTIKECADTFNDNLKKFNTEGINELSKKIELEYFPINKLMIIYLFFKFYYKFFDKETNISMYISIFKMDLKYIGSNIGRKDKIPTTKNEIYRSLVKFIYGEKNESGRTGGITHNYNIHGGSIYDSTNGTYKTFFQEALEAIDNPNSQKPLRP